MFVKKTLKTQEDLEFFTTGTKDQRGYALDIKRAFEAEFESLSQKVSGAFADEFEKAVAEAKVQADAIWWIERKQISAIEMIDEILEN